MEILVLNLQQALERHWSGHLHLVFVHLLDGHPQTIRLVYDMTKLLAVIEVQCCVDQGVSNVSLRNPLSESRGSIHIETHIADHQYQLLVPASDFGRRGHLPLEGDYRSRLLGKHHSGNEV